MCLSETTPVQEITINDRKYLVFQCDVCQAKKQGKLNNENIKCIECHNHHGYLKKISLSTPKQQNDDEFGFIHPICALSFPNIYALGGP